MTFLSEKRIPALLALFWFGMLASATAHAQVLAPVADTAPDESSEPEQAQPASVDTGRASQAPGAPASQPFESPPEVTPEIAAPEPDRAKKICVWGRPRAQCKSNPILEMSFFFPNNIEYSDLMFNVDAGALFSRPGNHALGVTVGAMCNSDCNFSIKGRYRHYLNNWISLDISPGLYTGATSGMQLEAAVQLSDFIALTGGFTTTSSSNGFENGSMTFIGIRAGLPLIILALAFAGAA